MEYTYYQRTQYQLGTNYQHIKKYENLRLKYIKAKNRRIFLLRCRSVRVFPKFIENWNHNGVRNLWRREDYKSTLRNFKASILNVEIKDSIHLIKFLENKLRETMSIINGLTQNGFCADEYFRISDKKFEKLFISIKNKHIKKLNHLCNFAQPKLNVNENWYQNISNIQVPHNVKLILSLGPKFNFKKDTIDKNVILNILKNTEAIITYNDDISAQELREDITKQTKALLNRNNNNLSTLSYCDIYLKQISNQTTKFLKQHPNIIITRADKGNVTVVQDKDDYIRKATLHLEDLNTYKRVPKNPTNKITITNNQMVKKWFDKKMIDKQTKDKLITTNTVSPRIYFLPKIHKPEIPFRPIVSCIDSPTYNVSKWLAQCLSKIVGKTDSNVKNSFEFVDKLRNVTIQNNHIMLSLDVIALYTNIPIDIALEILDKRWNDIQQYTDLSKTEFKAGVKFCLTNTYFDFDHKTYRQIHGCAMGSPISSVIANLVLEELEARCLEKLDDTPTFYYRYVDDIIMTYNKDKIQQLVTIFNSFHDKLQFTHELEQNNTISFLDVALIRPNGSPEIITNWFQKQTHSWRYMHFLSNHPRSQKVNVLNNVIDRALKLAHPMFRVENLCKVKRAFTENGFPLGLIKKCIMERTHKLYNTQNNAPQTVTHGYVALPYVNESFLSYKKTFKKYDVCVAYSKYNTNEKHFSNLKTPIAKLEKSNVVYSIPCKGCARQYIGTTSQRLRCRLTQHKSDTTKKPLSTGLAIHTNTTGHIFDYDKVKILDCEKNYNKRLISEMLWIQSSSKFNVNKKTETNQLDKTYKDFLKNLDLGIN